MSALRPRVILADALLAAAVALFASLSATLAWAAVPPRPAAVPPRPATPTLSALGHVSLRAGAAFGTAVAGFGTTLVVGAPLLGGGVAYVYTREAGIWRETGELRGSGTRPGDFFGGSVAVRGSTIVVGADSHGTTGRAYVFSRGSRGWHQAAELAGAGGPRGSGFGYSVAIGAGTVVVGAPMPVVGSGAAYVFAATRGAWHQVAELRPRLPSFDSCFGFSVAAAGREALVGEPGDKDGAGRAFVFSSGPGGWRQTAELAGRDTQAGDNFGFSVAESAGRALVGAPWHSGGAAYLFSASPGGWHETGEVSAGGTRAGDKFGWSVALGAALVLICAPGQGPGRAYLYPQGASFRQGDELAGPSAPGSYFGAASAVSGTAVVIGANGYRGGTGAALVTTAT
ncbi:MAG TPA: hypothetical protein VME46_18445 [Acidimicrobiales bacterium]|nr:hypothetical protein [Acidimicrobiales bacterium]